MGTHYDTLGVGSRADPAALRAAYLAKARAHHPDRHAEASPATRAREARTMREVNAAWTVLSDPDARLRYDATIAPPPRPAAATARPPARDVSSTPRSSVPSSVVHGGHDEGADLVGRGLRVLPTAVVLILLLGIFVFTAFAASGGDLAPTVTVAPGDLVAGTCVRTGQVLTTVPCSGTHDATVAAIVAVARGCPVDTAVYTLDPRRVACLRPVP